MKRILIVGADSYIGTNFEEYIALYREQYYVHTIDARGLQPSITQFEGYDAVFFVAGIVHKKETGRNIHLYYDINRDLAIETARTAKKAGVGQFVLLSSMSVYGLAEGKIAKRTIPNPITHYAKSKLQADRAIWKMREADFNVSVLRPPMVYGRGCKGNYQILRKLALAVFVFPKVDNQRSMIYIGNLCEFVKDVIDDKRSGLFFPQNAEYVNISNMVQSIAFAHGKKIKLLPGFNWIGRLSAGIIKKAFASLTYDQGADIVEKYSFQESMRLTEGLYSGYGE